MNAAYDSKRLPKLVRQNIDPLTPSDSTHSDDNAANFVLSVLLCMRLASNATSVHSKAIAASTAPFQFT